jgi:hypothetical protein
MSRLLQVTLTAAFVLFSAITVRAQENVAPTGRSVHSPADSAAIFAASTASDPRRLPEPARSSRTLRTLFATYGALQGLDIYSTNVAVRAGAYEANPLMAGNTGRVLGMKAVMGLTTYYAVNNIAKKNRKMAVITMFVLNGVSAAVVAHNLRNSRR